MKQLVQDFKSGAVKLAEVPAPTVAPGMVLVRNACSVVSAGTERATVEMGQASLLGKARQRPELVKQVLETVRKEGVAATVRKVQSRLDQWKQLGYATAGTVLEIGDGVRDLAPGDRVACAGQDFASHAEIVCVPQHLCARAPEGVPLAHAAFGTLGAIALQGIRQADVRLGESVAVLGLGLIGQLTVQLLRAAGCRVHGHDPRAEAVTLAQVGPGAADQMDAVIITAATDSSEPLRQAADLCRDRGRVVLVGVTGMELPRDLYFRKELSFVLSRSYGPGRYDPQYELHGIDYPLGYVRWTEQRNLQAFLELLGAGRLDLARLITHTFPITEAVKAYEIVLGQPGIGVVLEYPDEEGRSPEGGVRTSNIEHRTSDIGHRTSNIGHRTSDIEHRTSDIEPTRANVGREELRLGVIGAGNYAQGVLLPLFKSHKQVRFATVCTATGVKAEKAREKFGFEHATTDWRAVIGDPRIDTVLVATRHDLHGPVVAAALRAGKTVFCEKPLCLTEAELAEIEAAGSQRLQVGFNRRFAPFAAALRAVPGPKLMRYRVSVAPLPAGHWVNDPQIGGGRVLGELCHFVDLLQMTAGARPVRVFAQGFGGNNVQVSVRFADGSVGSVDYFEVAGVELAKEQIEVFGGGRQEIVTDFRDKGQAEQVRRFVAAVCSGAALPVGWLELIASTRASLAVIGSLQTGQAIGL